MNPTKKKHPLHTRKGHSPRFNFTNSHRIKFVFHYDGEGTGMDAIRKAIPEKAELPDMKIQTWVQRMLKDPFVKEGLTAKHAAAIKTIEKRSQTVVEIAAEENFTLRMVFRNLVKIIEPPAKLNRDGSVSKKAVNGSRDYDKIKAMELGSKICNFIQTGMGLPAPPPGSVGSAQAGIVREGEKTFFMYRSEWRDDGSVAGHAPALSTANGNG